MAEFYDRLAPDYHLIFPDWDASIEHQGGQLAHIIALEWPVGVARILDVCCGIGTQSFALAGRGFNLTSSDLSAGAVARARKEAAARGYAIDFSVCDMRQAFQQHGSGFDLVISCDNSITHLLNDSDILTALRQMYACARPGGGCLLTVRDYDNEAHGRGLIKPFGTRDLTDKRYIIFQVWDFDGDHYDFAMYFVADEGPGGQVKTQVLRHRYYAIGTGKLMDLMTQAGFTGVRRLDDVFFQPVLVGTKPAAVVFS